MLEVVIKDNCEKFFKQKQLITKNFEEKQEKLAAKQCEYLELVK